MKRKLIIAKAIASIACVGSAWAKGPHCTTGTMQTSYHYTTKNALLAEIDRLGLGETIKQFLTNGPTLPNNYPKRPFRWFTTCKVDNKYERMVCGHWEDSGYYTACRVAPPQMCKVLIPASM